MITLVAHPISLSEKRALVQRIVASKQFARSERLTSFLWHICELEIQGRLSELNEKEIGHAVFNLPNDYDPSVDGIVRSHASRLRRKLEMYYLREGREEAIRLVIPRGRYQPRFESMDRLSPEPPDAESMEDPIGEEFHKLQPAISESPDSRVTGESEGSLPGDRWFVSALKKRRFVLVLLPVLAVIAAVLFYFTNQLRVGRAEANPVWDELFTKQRSTIIVPGDSGVVMWQETMRKNLSLSDYISSTSPWKTNMMSPGQEHLPNALIRRRYTSIVDLDIIQKLSRLAYSKQVEPVLRYARDVRPNDLKDSNVVLIGSSETNPWTQMFQGEMNFVLHKDQERMIYTIENRHPMKGEPSEWTSDSLMNLRTVYCKVSYLANPSGEGNILTLEGTSMAGTECAWEFISRKDEIKQFLIQNGLRETRLPHFEILLKTSNLAGDSASSSIVAWRVTR